MTELLCTVSDCVSPVYCRSMCVKHYSRYRRHSNPYTDKTHDPRPEYVKPSRSPEERFWEKVVIPDDPYGCWLWIGSVYKDSGYGQFSVSKLKTVLAHRYAWSLYHDKPVPPGLLVRHTCDVRLCMAPYNLILGTHKQNRADFVERGRATNQGPRLITQGSGNPFAVLTERDAYAIRYLYENELLTYPVLAAAFQVAESTIGNIVSGRSWTHVPQIPLLSN